jgi:hypothetical protein
MSTSDWIVCISISNLLVTFLNPFEGDGLDGAGDNFSASSAYLVSNSPRVALPRPFSKEL